MDLCFPNLQIEIYMNLKCVSNKPPPQFKSLTNQIKFRGYSLKCLPKSMQHKFIQRFEDAFKYPLDNFLPHFRFFFFFLSVGQSAINLTQKSYQEHN